MGVKGESDIVSILTPLLHLYIPKTQLSCNSLQKILLILFFVFDEFLKINFPNDTMIKIGLMLMKSLFFN